MGLSHTEPAYTVKAAPLIEEFGGKMGGLKYIQSHCEELRERVLPMFTLRPGEEWNGQQFPGANIIRGSHPHDFQGLVDVLETKTALSKNSDDIPYAVFLLRRGAESEEVMDYARYENSQYDGKITVGIQPHNGGLRGSVVEHPNQPGNFLVTRIIDRGDDMCMPSVGRYDQQGALQQDMNYHPEALQSEKTLIDFYKIIQRSELVKDHLSFQMEFGGPLDNPSIYQVRAFTNKQVADFVLEEYPSRTLTFGVTPPDGIVMPYATWNPSVAFSFPGNQNPGVPWALLRTYHYHDRDLSFQPKNMAAYLAGQCYKSSAWQSLEHGHFSMAQKADVTLFEGRVYRFEKLAEHKGGTLRIISDGRGATVKLL